MNKVMNLLFSPLRATGNQKTNDKAIFNRWAIEISSTHKPSLEFKDHYKLIDD
jgi:hypothetical protein